MIVYLKLILGLVMSALLSEFQNIARVHYTYNNIVRKIENVMALKQTISELETGATLPPDRAATGILLHDSLVLSVIQYCRPFKKNRDSEGSSLVFPSDVKTEHSHVHEQLLNLRDKAIAHTDGDFAEKLEGIVLTVEQTGPKSNRLGYRWSENYLRLPGVDLAEYRSVVGFVHDEIIRPKMLNIAAELGLEPTF